ncbi:virulence factor SrfC family protein [Atlantibacter hermannii]|uniref:virulence factor SrfC family protein n=1 Tax=Atlantibacter hermannii TaxID=565 RepID=UPI0028ACFF32|nr:virulence factor SrfC family protein [Atlantibacter hermannii]
MSVTSSLPALENWLAQARQRSALLDAQASALQLALARVNAKAQALQDQAAAPRTLALCGAGQASKAFLLSALCGSEQGRLPVTPGKHLDYLAHINPGHNATAMALRFTSRPAISDAFPLTLRLFSEAELVTLFIAHYHQQPHPRGLDDALLRKRLDELQPLRQPMADGAITTASLATIVDGFTRRVGARARTVQMDTWHRFATLIPHLSLSERSQLYALLWGDQRELTAQWFALAETLQLLGHHAHIAAPLSLLVDNFSLPEEGFLLCEHQEGTTARDVLVCAIDGDTLQPALSVSVSQLALLCAELALPLENPCALGDVDLLDVPAPACSAAAPLWQTKRAFLLERYRQQAGIDLLVICGATPDRISTPSVARTLLRWVDDTHPVQEDTLPGLVWAITPGDGRFSGEQHLDDGVQRLLGKPGQRWGTLQALDSRSLPRLLEWLSEALSMTRRTKRHAVQQQRLRQTLVETFAHYHSDNAAAAEAEPSIRALQRQASRHGDILAALLPSVATLQALCDSPDAAPVTRAQGLFDQHIDLFAEPLIASEQSGTDQGSLATRTHQLWINHVRQWSQQPEQARLLDLEPSVLVWLGETLIVASYRLKLDTQLEKIAAEEGVCGALLYAGLGNFITWLGVNDLPVEARPASRVNAGQPVFAPQPGCNTRLTKLSEQPAHAATGYVYDWLVTLYHLARGNQGYQHPQAVTAQDKQALVEIVSTLSY